MTETKSIKHLEEKKVRAVWNQEAEEWYFSVTDLVMALTASVDPKQYIKKVKMRDPGLRSEWNNICVLIPFMSADGKIRNEIATSTVGAFRIMQSIPSHRVEPFKKWMAEVVAQRFNQMENPELSIEQAVMDYRRLGYSDQWINQRIRDIEKFRDHEDQSHREVLHGGMRYVSLNEIITNGWSRHTLREYKRIKLLNNASLHDNLTNIESVVNNLALVAAHEISRQRNSHCFDGAVSVCNDGIHVAKIARTQLESLVGRSISSSEMVLESTVLPEELENLEPVNGGLF